MPDIKDVRKSLKKLIISALWHLIIMVCMKSSGTWLSVEKYNHYCQSGLKIKPKKQKKLPYG
jgi:hypothetical protein